MNIGYHSFMLSETSTNNI